MLGQLKRRFILLGPTPPALLHVGLPSGVLAMSAAKIARCHREHPEVGRAIWHCLPSLIDDPAVVVPSARGDGSVVATLVVSDARGFPIVVPVAPGTPNVILSVYAKELGWDWVATQIRYAHTDGLQVYEKNGFIASVPQPELKYNSSSSGPIPADGTMKPSREILTIRSIVKPIN